MDAQSNIPFEKAWLKNYVIIPSIPQGSTIKVDVPVKGRPFLYFDEETERSRYIINLKAIRKSDLGKLKEIFQGRDSVDASELNDIILNGNIFVNEGVEPTLPSPNETVAATFGWVENRQEEMILACTTLAVKPSVAGSKIDVDTLFSDEVESETDEDVEDLAGIMDEDDITDN